MSLLNPVRSTLKTTTRSIQPRTISTTASKHALNIYVRSTMPLRLSPTFLLSVSLSPSSADASATLSSCQSSHFCVKNASQVRWDDPSNHAKFDEAKVRAFFSYKGFETRQIVPLNNADRIGKGVNSALVEIRDEEVDRCLKLDYGVSLRAFLSPSCPQ